MGWATPKLEPMDRSRRLSFGICHRFSAIHERDVYHQLAHMWRDHRNACGEFDEVRLIPFNLILVQGVSFVSRDLLAQIYKQQLEN